MKMNKELIKLISLEKKVAVITGAASGIGLAAARRMAQAGAQVAVVDIDDVKGKEAVREIEKIGTRVKFYRCDVTSYSDCRKTADLVYKEFGRMDILFNNAGVISRRNTVDLKEKEWDKVVAADLKSIYLLSHHVIPYMINNGGGAIVNNGSGWGLKGGPDAAAYCAAKGGVVNLTRAMAVDHGKQNIRVNCVCPGDTRTPLLNQEASLLGEDQNEFIQKAAERPLRRVGSPEDIANAVLFLASDMSSWVTGSVLVVDGGGLA
ncbi:MAG: SDR family NAD(P)-dependent oxidoreductase [Candidatus Aminicenantes bacterium]